jgi:antitoxin component YwqK of YwqJK toxin-antitoxin module
VAGYEEGEWLYRNGTSEETGKYDGGKKEGLWITTFDKDHVAFEIRYDQDVRDGKYTAYWENGAVKTLGKYSKGLQEGQWTYFDDEGHTLLTTLFKDGREIKWNDYTIK